MTHLRALEGKKAEAQEEAARVSPVGENRRTIPIVLALTGRRQEAERLACREKEGAWGRYAKVDPICDGIRSGPSAPAPSGAVVTSRRPP
jgi:hypothetical protein